jgi:hypothetical protein
MATICGTPFILQEWQAAAERGATEMKRLQAERSQIEFGIRVMARWLAKKAVKQAAMVQ